MPLTESIYPKDTSVATFPTKSVVNDENVEKCRTKATYSECINLALSIPLPSFTES